MPNNASHHDNLTIDDISQNDHIVVSNTDELISSRSGNDTIDGGPGNDTTVHHGEANQYSITQSGTSIVVADNMTSRDGTDTLTNVVHVQFTDRSIDLTMTADAARVSASQLDTAGSTAPTASESGYWDHQVTSGLVMRSDLIDHVFSDAQSLANDPARDWVNTLLNNTIAAENTHAVQLGVDYNSPTDAITHTVEIAHAITPTDTEAAIKLIGAANNVNLDWWA